MTHATEFPDYDAATLPVIPAHWQDASWKNEACPFFIINRDAGVYVDYADASKREFPSTQRFTITSLVDGRHPADYTHEPLLCSDDWRDVLAWEYVDRIGYNPFEDDGSCTEAEIAQALADHAAQRAADTARMWEAAEAQPGDDDDVGELEALRAALGNLCVVVACTWTHSGSPMDSASYREAMRLLGRDA